MRPHSLVLALALALGSLTPATAGSGFPPPSSKPDEAAEFERKRERRKPTDCHRDVRTHRIGGVRVTHRHVGDRCQVRVVRKFNSL